jgi:hypothetical protein
MPETLMAVPARLAVLIALMTLLLNSSGLGDR